MSDESKSSTDLATKWNVRHQYSKEQSDASPEAASVLADHIDFLPKTGRALDLAAGRGGNARLMAAHGLDSHAWDLSSVAMDELKTTCPDVIASVRDVVKNPPEPDSFDVVVVSRFLDRSLCPAIQSALRVDGVLFYQTFTKGLSNPDFMLQPNELPKLFSGLSVEFYSELVDGNEAQLIARHIRPNTSV